jgi:recombinational DNA repair protein (RecF pathway)
MDHNLKVKTSQDKCFLCKQFLQIGHVNNQNKGVFCIKCAETYDPNIFPIPNKVNSAYYDKLGQSFENLVHTTNCRQMYVDRLRIK